MYTSQIKSGMMGMGIMIYRLFRGTIPIEVGSIHMALVKKSVTMNIKVA